MDKEAFKKEVMTMVGNAKDAKVPGPYKISISKKMAIRFGLKENDIFGGAVIEVKIYHQHATKKGK